MVLPPRDAGCGLRDERGHRLRLRPLNGVAGGDIGQLGAGPFGHRVLRRWRNHPVLCGDGVCAGSRCNASSKLSTGLHLCGHRQELDRHRFAVSNGIGPAR